MTEAAEKLLAELMKLPWEEREALALRVLEPANDDMSTEERAELEQAIEESVKDHENGDFEDAVAFADRLVASS